MVVKKIKKKLKKKFSKCELDDDCGCGSDCSCGSSCSHGNCSAMYCLGMVGAAVYYIMTATGFWNGVLGVLKALVWPAFLVFEAMKFLGM